MGRLFYYEPFQKGSFMELIIYYFDRPEKGLFEPRNFS